MFAARFGGGALKPRRNTGCEVHVPDGHPGKC